MPRALLPLLASLVAVLACSRGEPLSPAAPEPPTAPAPAAAPATGHAAPAVRPPPEPGWGEPDMPKLRKLFRTRSAQIRACYEAVLQHEPTTSGRFTLRFTIVPGGGIEEVGFASSTFRTRDVPRCIADVVRRWSTPFRPAGPVAVEYPLRFTPL